MRKIAIILPLILLAACSARQIIANPSGVTYDRVSHGNITRVAAAAQKHCAQYGKNAIQSDRGSGSVTYRCE